ncbi:MAG: HlyC/CorC family transporter [Alphaproteobacteria bacterium]|nr:HlyC/CorC family transporter [Alphaproteobacteria bacterium]
MDEAPEARQERRPSLIQSVRGWVKAALASRPDTTIKEAIEEVLEEHQEQAGDALAPEEKLMLRNVLSFGDITVHDIMIPRMDIIAVADDIEMEELKRHVVEEGHTRFPVYHESLDRVEGFLHIKDLFPVLAGDQSFDLKRILRPMLFVPPSMKIIDLLVSMRRRGSHMAIVVDEYGGTDGLVTLEDLFEEIVGDIQDEHDDEAAIKDIVRTADGVFEADARVRIEKLEQVLGVDLLETREEEEFDTLGGLIVFDLGRMPEVGEVVHHDDSGVSFEILEADPRCVKRVRIQMHTRPAAAPPREAREA